MRIRTYPLTATMGNSNIEILRIMSLPHVFLEGTQIWKTHKSCNSECCIYSSGSGIAKPGLTKLTKFWIRQGHSPSNIHMALAIGDAHSWAHFALCLLLLSLEKLLKLLLLLLHTISYYIASKTQLAILLPACTQPPPPSVRRLTGHLRLRSEL